MGYNAGPIIPTGNYTPIWDSGHLKQTTFDKVYECQQLAVDGDWEEYEKLVDQLSDEELDRLININSQGY